MTTLVTGAGLLGTSFAQCAIKRGEDVVFFDPEPRADYLKMRLGDTGYKLVRGDVRNLADLVAAVKASKATTIVHTAGLIGGRVQQEISAAFDINVGGTKNVAEAVRLGGIKRLVHASTFGTYNWRLPMPSKVTEDLPLGPGRAYGAFKVAKEMVLEAYSLKFGFELVMIRPGNVFGVGHFWAGSSGGQKVHDLVIAGLEGRKAVIPIEETYDNEYVYAKDVGRALDLAATVAKPKHIAFNVGNGVITPVEGLIAAVKAAFPNMEIEIAKGNKPEGRAVPMDISRAKNELGWAPTYSLAEAFIDYRKDMEAGRKAMT
jgi:nucleoside-diphosphate-sugar epimerase